MNVAVLAVEAYVFIVASAVIVGYFIAIVHKAHDFFYGRRP